MIRAEAFDLLNHPNYFNPDTTYEGTTQSTFGVYTYARNPRQLQGAVKVTF